MRDIRFRGKRSDNGDWVYGYLFRRFDVNKYHYAIQVSKDGEGSFEYYNVDPSTVGQFTGLQDKNGKDIYENDILFNPYFCDKWKVIFVDGAFMVELIGDDEKEYLGLVPSFEKIGNIHDNPELLKEA